MGAATEDIKLQKEQKRIQFNGIDASSDQENIKKYIFAFNWPQSHRIAIYYPLKQEIDLRFLHQKYPRIVYPVSEGMSFVFADKKTSFQKKSLFYEPCRPYSICPTEEIDVFFVPGLAFDRRGGRLGRGRGFYDRVLSLSPESLKIGAAWSQKVESYDFLPQEKTDVKMDILVTEKYILWVRQERRRN